MAILLDARREAPRPCSYLPAQSASLDVQFMVDVTPEELGDLLARGWRRFGPSYFRPACPACSACVPTRIPTNSFVPSRSQRRARNQASNLRRIVGSPVVDRERLDLYARWHGNRERHRAWDAAPLEAEGYAMEFAFPHPSVREVAFRRADDRLVGLGIVDEVPDALSAVYFFWDPEHAPPSLGTAHVVSLIESAAASGLRYVYLGYLVADCPSLAYKARYQPSEALTGWPGNGDVAVWTPVPRDDERT